jgi:CRP-like cAMP-binding protein
MIEKMFAALERLHHLNDVMKERLTAITEIKTFPKNHLLLKEGETSNYACFVLKGFARAYYVIDGKAITSRFMTEDFMITSWISFYTRKPGYEYIELLEDSVLGCMHYNDVQALYKDLPGFNMVGRKLIEYYFFLAEQRTQMLRKHTAEEKYHFFLQHYPDLLQRVSLKYIATYLGMSEETLSRVRGKAARNKG